MADDNGGDPPEPPEEDGQPEEEDDSRLPAEIRGFLEDLPDDRKRKLSRYLVSLRVTSSWQAPLPRPRDFADYERVRPGTAEDIIQMAKSGRRAMDDALGARIKNERLMVWVAVLIVVGLIGVSTTALILGPTDSRLSRRIV